MRVGPASVLRDFLRSEAAGGLLLIGAAVAAIGIANSQLSDGYFSALHARVGPLDIHSWINDALMSIFFLLVGLEIKRELLDGHLADAADRRLPIIAAVAGMAAPAIIYMVVSGGGALAPGWAIPAATDIAFALGLMALLGKRAPPSLRLFLTTVAIVDDIGAVLIIAFFYTATLDLVALATAVLLFGAMVTLNRMGVKRLTPYIVLAMLLWAAVWQSGVHATIAGAVTALTIPISRNDFISPLHKLEHALQPWVAYAILPLFGFANAGVPLGSENILAPLPLGIAAGLFVGKQIGVFGSVWVAVRVGVAARPARTGWMQIYGVSLLCGIGFTMSLFIGGLAFPDAEQADAVKLGVLMGSLLSATTGFALLRFTKN